MMENEQEIFDPKRIRFTTVISNLGKKPFIISSFGLANLKFKDKEKQIEINGVENNELTPSGFFFVGSDKPRIAAFYSKKTLSEIEAELFPSGDYSDIVKESEKYSNIEMLFATSVLSFDLTLFRLTGDKEPEILNTKREGVFGRNSFDNFKKLANRGN